MLIFHRMLSVRDGKARFRAIHVFFGLDPAPPSFRHARPPKRCRRVRRPSGLDSSASGTVSRSVVPDLFRKSVRQEKGGTFLSAVCENKRAEVDGVLAGKGIYFERFNFGCNLVNAMQRCLEMTPIHYRKDDTHTYTYMMKTGNYLKSVMTINIDTRIC